MVGVGKLLKQAQKMQQKMEEAQALLSEEIIEVSGEAVQYQSRFQGKVNSRDYS
jgi:DNA-binding protein YbaB